MGQALVLELMFPELNMRINVKAYIFIYHSHIVTFKKREPALLHFLRN